MAFTADEKFAPLEQKVWLATPTMHGEELTYMTEASVSYTHLDVYKRQSMSCKKGYSPKSRFRYWVG